MVSTTVVLNVQHNADHLRMSLQTCLAWIDQTNSLALKTLDNMSMVVTFKKKLSGNKVETRKLKRYF